MAVTYVKLYTFITLMKHTIIPHLDSQRKIDIKINIIQLQLFPSSKLIREIVHTQTQTQLLFDAGLFGKVVVVVAVVVGLVESSLIE